MKQDVKQVMKIISTGIVFLFFLPYCFSQNLVPNPGFEEFFSCPQGINANKTNSKIAPHWNSPSYGTPDLYNKCSKYQMGIQNATGFTNPYKGEGFAGIIVWEGKKGYREYLQVKLNEPLKADHLYTVSFYYKLSSYSKYSADRIGFCMSDTTVFFKIDTALPVHSSYTKTKYNPMDIATGSWEYLEAEYLAKGGEKYLSIGNFEDNKTTKSFHLSFVSSQEPMLEQAAYYYLDEVSVMDKSGTADLIAPVPTLKFDDKVMKTDVCYVLEHVLFDYDSDSLLPASFAEIDKIKAILKENPSWKIRVRGHTDNEGSADYNLDLSERRARSVRNFLIKGGIKEERIQAIGYGNQMPLVKENNEDDRRKNRRVEVQLLEFF